MIAILTILKQGQKWKMENGQENGVTLKHPANPPD